MRHLLWLLLFTTTVSATELPRFAGDQAADQWLRATSPFYLKMATSVDAHGGYKFRASKLRFAGNVEVEDGQRYIELRDDVTGAERVSVLVFEMTNAFQSPRHQEVDDGAATGRINTTREFGLLHELVELDGLRLHRNVLVELDHALGGIPVAMLHWVNPELKSLQDYNVPYAYDYIKAQAASGHTAHYYAWFAKQQAAPAPNAPASAPNAPAPAPNAPAPNAPAPPDLRSAAGVHPP